MKFRATLLVPVVGALVAGLLVASPAEAVRTQIITGTVNGPGGAGNVGPVRVELISVDRGGNQRVYRFAKNVPNGGTFTFRVPLNGKKKTNKASRPYRLRISAASLNGQPRSWYWRGRNNAPSGGGRHLRDGSVITATRNGPFRANVRYSSIIGTAPVGTQLTVAGAPATYKGSRNTRRELDLPGCANVFGSVTSKNGSYRFDFLPFAPGDRRYMVAAVRGGHERWNNSFGSCFDVQGYRFSRANMLALKPAGLVHNVTVGASGNNLKVVGSFSGFKATSEGDRFVSIREAEPKTAILDSPIVAQRRMTGNTATFNNLAPGRYYVELGRRTGCADWYPSRYSNNNAYFKGADRASERWKTFSSLSKVRGNRTKGQEKVARTVQPNPATDAQQGKKPRGAAGWMYRTHCKALGYGSIRTIDISGVNKGTRQVSLTSKRGGVVKGRVSRAKGRTNKEMMVTIRTVDGKRVLRTDLTDGSGTFYVAGLAPGRYSISVNSDSWRGIGRKFKGRHTITVRAGRTSNAGTLKFLD